MTSGGSSEKPAAVNAVVTGYNILITPYHKNY